MCSQLSISMGSTSTDSTSTVCSLLNPWVWNVLKWRGRQYTHMCGCKYRIYIFLIGEETFYWKDMLHCEMLRLWKVSPFFFSFLFILSICFVSIFFVLFLLIFLAAPMACGTSHVRYQTYATTVTQAPALTAPDPKSTAPQENSCLVSILSLVEPQELKRGRGRNFSFLTYISSLTPGSVF